MKKKQSGIYMNDMKGNSLLMFTFQQNGIHLDFSKDFENGEIHHEDT